jgi:succinoglycan biosynthesis transport protein ExoP
MADTPQKSYGPGTQRATHAMSSSRSGAPCATTTSSCANDSGSPFRLHCWSPWDLDTIRRARRRCFQQSPPCSSRNPNGFVLEQQVVDPSVTSEIDVNTYLLTLQSARIRNRVLASLTPEELALVQKPYLDDVPAGKPLPARMVALGVLTATAIRNSYLMSVAVAHRDPRAAALIANRYVDQFMQDLLDRVGGSNDYAVESLKSAAEKLRQSSEEAQVKLMAYMREKNLVSLDNSVNIVAERLRRVNEALVRIREERLSNEQLYAQVEGFRRDGRSLLEISYIANHGSIPAIRSQLNSLIRDRSVFEERYLEKHPTMIKLAHAITISQQQLDRAIELAVKDLESTLERIRSQEKTFEAEFRDQEQAQLRLRDISVDYETLKKQADVATNNYTQVLNRLTGVTTSSNLQKFPVRPLDRATPPDKPSHPISTASCATAQGFSCSFSSVWPSA